MGEPISRRHVYRLTVQGEMSEVIQAEFSDVELWVADGGTQLRADLPDTAALYGLIGRIEALGLVLVDLHRSSPPASMER